MENLENFNKLNTESVSIKQEAWNNMKSEVLKSASEFENEKMEEGIMDTVVVMNLLGINTMESCEGHVDKEKPYPSVIFGSKKHSQFYSKEVNEINTKYRNVKGDSPEYRELLESTKEESSNLKNKVQILLDEFYSGKEWSPYHYGISVFTKDSMYILAPVGLENTENNSIENKRTILDLSRKEMNNFTEFLKNKFYKEN